MYISANVVPMGTPFSLVTQLVEKPMQGTVTMTSFSVNSVSAAGGGVSAQGQSNVYIAGNTVFSNNAAGDGGGGVSVQEISNVYISGNTTLDG